MGDAFSVPFILSWKAYNYKKEENTVQQLERMSFWTEFLSLLYSLTEELVPYQTYSLAITRRNKKRVDSSVPMYFGQRLVSETRWREIK